jgi:hypothetical protein
MFETLPINGSSSDAPPKGLPLSNVAAQEKPFSWVFKTMTIGLLSFRLLCNLLTCALGQMKLSTGLM